MRISRSPAEISRAGPRFPVLEKRLAPGCDALGLGFQLAPALRLQRAQQLLLTPQHPRPFGVAFDSRDAIRRAVTTSWYHSIASRASHDIF